MYRKVSESSWKIPNFKAAMTSFPGNVCYLLQVVKILLMNFEPKRLMGRLFSY